jgi:hypothetical protein
MVIILLPYAMLAGFHLPFRSQSLHRSFFTSFPLCFSSCDPRPLGRCPGAFMSLGSSDSSPITRSYSPLGDNPFRIRTSAKHALNPFTIRTSKTQNLKSFRIRTHKKTGRGRVPVTITNSPRSAHSASLRYFFSSLSTTHYSLLTSPIFCLRLIFLLSSTPNRENAYVSK